MAKHFKPNKAVLVPTYASRKFHCEQYIDLWAVALDDDQIILAMAFFHAINCESPGTYQNDSLCTMSHFDTSPVTHFPVIGFSEK